jgi:hypothetical protein
VRARIAREDGTEIHVAHSRYTASRRKMLVLPRVSTGRRPAHACARPPLPEACLCWRRPAQIVIDGTRTRHGLTERGKR